MASTVADIRDEEDRNIFAALDAIARESWIERRPPTPADILIDGMTVGTAQIVSARTEILNFTTPTLTPGRILLTPEPRRIRSVEWPERHFPNERMLLNQQDWLDIVQWSEASRPDPSDTFRVEYLGQPRNPEEPRQETLRGNGWMIEEMPGQVVVNERAVQARRVQVPEFELFSNPTIRIDEVRQRRFDLIDRGDRNEIVARLLEALLRKKRPFTNARPQPNPFVLESPDARPTIWEALVELDLVDAEHIGPESRT